jgi:hypothetical protein
MSLQNVYLHPPQLEKQAFVSICQLSFQMNMSMTAFPKAKEVRFVRPFGPVEITNGT